MNNTDRSARLYMALQELRPEISLDDSEWKTLVLGLVSLSEGELRAVMRVLEGAEK